MKLQLFRPAEPILRRERSTLGFLYLDGKPFCFTLEDVLRPPFIKIQDKTAIPEGTYNVLLTFSPHFHKLMPELIDVPMFTGIRIHPGNSDLDTSGCILVGDSISMSEEKPLRDSAEAFDRLMTTLTYAFDRPNTVTIEVKGGLSS